MQRARRRLAEPDAVRRHELRKNLMMNFNSVADEFAGDSDTTVLLMQWSNGFMIK